MQSDVHGACETEYTLLKAKETSLVLRKAKKMSTCSTRYKQHSVIQTTPYQFPSVSHKEKEVCNRHDLRVAPVA